MIKHGKVFGILIAAFILLLSGCVTKSDSSIGKVEAVEINISAAASLKDALIEIQTQYGKESEDILQFNFGGSGALQKQIEEGAPCDLFISAAKSNMDTLEEAGFILTDSRKDLLGNHLVLIASKEMRDKILSSEFLTSADVKSIAIGTPESVPAGKYAKQALTDIGLWDKIQEKIILAKDVKQVLEYVETGNVDCGFVYTTDALLLKSGVMVSEDFSASHDSIIYTAALIKDSTKLEAAKNFYEFLETDYSKEVFKKYGFVIM